MLTTRLQTPGLEGEHRLTAVTGAFGGGVGARTRSTCFSQGGTRTAVETGLTLLTLGALGVPLTVQAAS